MDASRCSATHLYGLDMFSVLVIVLLPGKREIGDNEGVVCLGRFCWCRRVVCGTFGNHLLVTPLQDRRIGRQRDTRDSIE